MSSQRTQYTRYVSIMGVCCLLAGCASESPTPPAAAAAPGKLAPAVMDGKVEPQFAYAAGYIFGERINKRLKEDALSVDDELILQGVRDGLKGNPARYTKDQMDDAMSRIEMGINKRRAEQQYAADPSFRKMADDNKKSSQEGLALYAMRPGVETVPSGILLSVLTPGTGRFVANATSVTMNAEMSLMDGTLLQKSEPNEPRTVALLRLPQAVAEVVRGMRVGEKSRLAIPAECAYGLAGRPPLIGPNQALLIEVEILSVK